MKQYKGKGKPNYIFCNHNYSNDIAEKSSFLDELMKRITDLKNHHEKHLMLLGWTGKGVGMRQLKSYAEHWEKEIPEEYQERSGEYFSARDAGNILKHRN